MLLPCEIAVKSLIPALRSTIAKELIHKHGLKQKDVADLLGVTQTAVSKYVCEVRGTVLKIEQVKAAVGVGSEFIVTPGFNPTVVDYCVKNKIPIVPGLNTPSFIEWGLERGLNYFKFYPADISGGPKMLRLLKGPYPTVKFMPTGGVNNQTLIEYLKLDNVFACGGSWIVSKELISKKHFAEITRMTKEAVSLVRSELK